MMDSLMSPMFWEAILKLFLMLALLRQDPIFLSFCFFLTVDERRCSLRSPTLD